MKTFSIDGTIYPIDAIQAIYEHSSTHGEVKMKDGRSYFFDPISNFINQLDLQPSPQETFTSLKYYDPREKFRNHFQDQKKQLLNYVENYDSNIYVSDLRNYYFVVKLRKENIAWLTKDTTLYFKIDIPQSQRFNNTLKNHFERKSVHGGIDRFGTVVKNSELNTPIDKKDLYKAVYQFYN